MRMLDTFIGNSDIFCDEGTWKQGFEQSESRIFILNRLSNNTHQNLHFQIKLKMKKRIRQDPVDL